MSSDCDLQEPAPHGSLEFVAPASKPGDYVVLKAEMDCIVAFSACPQDIIPVRSIPLRSFLPGIRFTEHSSSNSPVPRGYECSPDRAFQGSNGGLLLGTSHFQILLFLLQRELAKDSKNLLSKRGGGGSKVAIMPGKPIDGPTTMYGTIRESSAMVQCQPPLGE